MMKDVEVLIETIESDEECRTLFKEAVATLQLRRQMLCALVGDFRDDAPTCELRWQRFKNSQAVIDALAENEPMPKAQLDQLVNWMALWEMVALFRMGSWQEMRTRVPEEQKRHQRSRQRRCLCTESG